MNSFSTENFTFVDFREMEEGMSRKVWECRNLPEIGKYMVNQDLITWDSHKSFINSLKTMNNKLYFSVLMEGVFVGSINLLFEDQNIAERGIYIKPENQGKGLAKLICKDFYKYFRDIYGLRSVTTKVLKGNVGSNALERSLGSVKVAEDDRFFYYKCDLSDL